MFRGFSVVFCSFFLFACGTEQIGKSPLEEVFVREKSDSFSSKILDIPEEISLNARIAKLTNDVSKISRVENKKLNDEIGKFKSNVLNFVYEYEQSNIDKQRKYMNDIHRNYVSIHSIIKKSGNKKDWEIFNHQLIKIKSEINILSEILKIDK